LGVQRFCLSGPSKGEKMVKEGGKSVHLAKERKALCERQGVMKASKEVGLVGAKSEGGGGKKRPFFTVMKGKGKTEQGVCL